MARNFTAAYISGCLSATISPLPIRSLGPAAADENSSTVVNSLLPRSIFRYLWMKQKQNVSMQSITTGGLYYKTLITTVINKTAVS